MRARLSSLALALTLVLSGCATAPHSAVPAGAVSALDRADLGFAEALAHYSQALIDEATPGGVDRSLAHWRAAVEGDPTNIVLRLKLGSALLGRKEIPEALRILEVARTVNPDSADVRLLLGMSYQMAGAVRPAEKEYRAVIRLAPDHPDGYIRLAALYLGERENSRVLAVIDAGMRHPGAADSVVQFCENMGRLYLVNGQIKEAIACFERMQARLPDNVPLREVLARCYALAGDRAKAITGLEEVFRRDPRYAGVATYLGELYEDANDPVRAAAYFERATELGPTDATPFLRLAFLQLKTDRAKALATLQRALLAVPDDPAIHAYLGLTFMQARHFEDAIASFARAESLAKAAGDQQIRPQFYFWYGSACDQAGHFEQAEKLFETCIQANPQADEALNYLAYMWALRGIKLDRALEYVQRALAIDPDDGAYIDTLGWVYFKRGDYELALTALKRANDLIADDPTITEHVGDALQALGQKREALRYWTKSLRYAPDNAELRAKLKENGVVPDDVPSPGK